MKLVYQTPLKNIIEAKGQHWKSEYENIYFTIKNGSELHFYATNGILAGKVIFSGKKEIKDAIKANYIQNNVIYKTSKDALNKICDTQKYLYIDNSFIYTEDKNDKYVYEFSIEKERFAHEIDSIDKWYGQVLDEVSDTFFLSETYIRFIKNLFKKGRFKNMYIGYVNHNIGYITIDDKKQFPILCVMHHYKNNFIDIVKDLRNNNNEE